MHSSEVKKYFGARTLGEHFYLFHAGTPASRLLITCHGVQTQQPSRCRVPLGSQLRYFCKQGEMLQDPLLHLSASDLVRPVEIIPGGQATFCYLLGRYHRDTYTAAALNAHKFGVDILTVRHRRGFRMNQCDKLSTAHIFEALAKAGLHYQIIDAQHCRGSYDGSYNGFYDSTPIARPHYDIQNPHLSSLIQKINQPTNPYSLP